MLQRNGVTRLHVCSDCTFSPGQRDIALADEVAEPHVGLGIFRQAIASAEDERHPSLVVVVELDVGDTADGDAGDAHFVAGLALRRVGEDGVVLFAIGGPASSHGVGEDDDGHRGDDDEDDQLDHRSGEAPVGGILAHRMVTSAPRRAGAPRPATQPGVDSGASPFAAP